MKELENDIIKKYSYEDYVVYIKENLNVYECYLQNENYGTINCMFGLSKEQVNLKQLIDIINDNLQQEIEYYKQEFED